MSSEILEFGEIIDGAMYVLRPGGYALINDDEGRIAVVSTPTGIFLPGGGVEGDESFEQAMVREVREECGLVVRVGRTLGTADQLVYAKNERTYFRKRCTFFTATIVSDSGDGCETDHELVWLAPEDAATQLKHESQRWAVGEVVRSTA